MKAGRRGGPVPSEADALRPDPRPGERAREWLDRQLRLLLAGGMMWLAGVGIGSAVLRWVGIGVLAVALALRVPRRRAEREARGTPPGSRR